MIIKISPTSRFFLTTFERLEENDGIIDIGEHICKGFFETYDDAFNALSDISKTQLSAENKYAVIELIESGYSPVCGPATRILFKYDKGSGSYKKINETEITNKFVNFAIN